MNERIRRLRDESFDTHPSIDIERALLETESIARTRQASHARAPRGEFQAHLREQDDIHRPRRTDRRRARPQAEGRLDLPRTHLPLKHDFEILTTRAQQNYTVAPEDMETYEKVVEPYWRGRCMRDRLFERMPEDWTLLYEAGTLRNSASSALSDTPHSTAHLSEGRSRLKKDIEEARAKLDFINDPDATAKDEQLQGMSISCDAVIIFAERHAELAEKMAAEEKDERRKAELLKIAEVCRRVPAHAPSNFWEAVQMYWFVHLGTITELNAGTP